MLHTPSLPCGCETAQAVKVNSIDRLLTENKWPARMPGIVQSSLFPRRQLESERCPCELLVMWRKEKCSPWVVKATSRQLGVEKLF